jgi:hypothetical protein
MAIPMKGESVVRVEGGEYTLAFTLGACAAIEGHYEGRGLQSILSDLEGNDPKISTLLVVIWAGLKKHHNLSLDEVGDIVSMDEAEAWGEAIGKAFAAGSAAPAKGDAQKGNPRRAAKAR